MYCITWIKFSPWLLFWRGERKIFLGNNCEGLHALNSLHINLHAFTKSLAAINIFECVTLIRARMTSHIRSETILTRPTFFIPETIMYEMLLWNKPTYGLSERNYKTACRFVSSLSCLSFFFLSLSPLSSLSFFLTFIIFVKPKIHRHLQDNRHWKLYDSSWKS